MQSQCIQRIFEEKGYFKLICMHILKSFPHIALIEQISSKRMNFLIILVSENKTLCHPASVDSLSTSAGTEDHVSMGGFAARKALQVVRNVEKVRKLSKQLSLGKLLIMTRFILSR